MGCGAGAEQGCRSMQLSKTWLCKTSSPMRPRDGRGGPPRLSWWGEVGSVGQGDNQESPGHALEQKDGHQEL